MSDIVPPASSTQTQTWAAIITAFIGALGAVLAKKRFTRVKAAVPKSMVTDTEFQEGLTALRNGIAAGQTILVEAIASNQKEVLAAITSQGNAVEKRLDALEATVARLDERTRK